MILWSASGLEGTLTQPKARVQAHRQGRRGLRRPVHVREQRVRRATRSKLRARAQDEPQPVFDYRALNKALIEIATRRYAGKRARRTPTRSSSRPTARSRTRRSCRRWPRCAARCPSSARSHGRCALPTDDAEPQEGEGADLAGRQALRHRRARSTIPRRWRCSTTSRSRRGSNRVFHAARSAPHHPQGGRPRPRGRGDPPPQHHADDGHDDDPPRRLHLPGGDQRDRAHRRHGLAAAVAVRRRAARGRVDPDHHEERHRRRGQVDRRGRNGDVDAAEKEGGAQGIKIPR